MAYTTIRLALTSEFKTILGSLKQDFPLMKESDLIKMAVSSFYTNYRQKNVSSGSSIRTGMNERRKTVAEDIASANKIVSAMWQNEPPRRTPSQAEIDAHLF